MHRLRGEYPSVDYSNMLLRISLGLPKEADAI